MRKLSLTVIALYAGLLAAYAQNDTAASGPYRPRKLQVAEIDFVTSYYHQDGNNSAVTGGIGTERLSDISNALEVRLYHYDRSQRKRYLNFELGVDHYTSASSDKIDPFTKTSASYSDTRVYPSLGYSIQNEKTGRTVGVVASASTEYDYISKGLAFNFAQLSKDRNREFSVRLQGYLDSWKVILPIELRGTNNNEGLRSYEPRNTFSGLFALSQVVNQRLQLALMAEPTIQQGLLATKYQRVYFTNGAVAAENLPDSRIKIPIGARASYFMGDRVVLRGYYRYFQDNWGVKAHTLDLEAPVKITPFVSISPFYRYYQQTAARYFAPYRQHLPTQDYFTSDYDLSHLHSHYAGAGFRVAPPNGVLGLRHWSQAEIRYGHYVRSNGLTANQVSLHIQLK